MSGPRPHSHGADRHESGTYEIRLTGHLDRRWSSWFDGFTVAHEAGGVTVLRGQIVDQSALHGLLQRVRDLAMPLISVVQVDRDQQDASTSTTDQPTTGSAS